MNYHIDHFQIFNEDLTSQRKWVSVIVANKYPALFTRLVDMFCGLDCGANVNLYRVEGDRTDFNFSKAMNAGIAASHDPYVLHLNDDVEALHPLWLAGLVEKLEAFDLPLICPIQLGDGWKGYEPFYMAAELEEHPIQYACSRNKYGPKYVLGFCLLARRVDLAELGGWDEAYTFCYEDLDLSLRAERLRCGRNGFDKTCWMRHGGHVTANETKKDPIQGEVLKGKIEASKALFSERWGSNPALTLAAFGYQGTYNLIAVTPINERTAGVLKLDRLDIVG